MTAGTDGHGLSASGGEAAAQLDSGPWYPPLPLWKLFLLFVLTFGLYSLFYLYRTARELRDRGNAQFVPWLYPFAFLIPITVGIAAGRLAAAAERTAKAQERYVGASPVLVGLAVFVTHAALSATAMTTLTSVYFGALVLYALPWLLLQHQLNRIKRARAETSFVSRPERYTKLQWAGLAAGGLLFALASLTLRDDYLRLSGDELGVGKPYADPLGRFVLEAPRGGWTLVGPNYLGEDSELEMLGPGPNDWAIVYVHEQTGWSIDDLVEFRFDQLADFTQDFEEVRRLFEGTQIAVSHARYSGTLALEGRSDYAVTSYVTPERAVEMIVFTAGASRALARGEALAGSLRPVLQDRATP